MSRLWSPAGGVPERPPPFGVWVGDRAPPAHPPAPPARPRWRRRPALLVAVGTVVVALAPGPVAPTRERPGGAVPRRVSKAAGGRRGGPVRALRAADPGPVPRLPALGAARPGRPRR